MNNEKTGGAAFPSPHSHNKQGMTLRDYFAAKALQGTLAYYSSQDWTFEMIKDMYKIADAMLEARK